MIKQLNKLAVICSVIALMTSCTARNIDVKTPDYSSLPDGTYRGSFDGGMVKATVDVLIAGERIEKVTIVSHKSGLGKPAEVIVNDIVKKQSLELDAITGATRSSKVILKAVEIALTK